MCDAEDVFQLLDSHGQEFTLGHLVEVRKQKALEETEEGQDHHGLEVD
jgi:hypothetical protein